MRKMMISTIVGGALLFSIGTPVSATISGNCGNGEISCLEVTKNLNEKFLFLKDKHIFYGKSDGKAHFDDKMTRAELASVLARMYTLDVSINEQPVFSDVKDDHWARNVIIAVTQAGFMDSKEGQFEPNKSVTLEELAATVVKAMNLDTTQYASIWLPGSTWAQKFLAAALAENILGKSEDYTKDALRSDFIHTVHAVYEKQFNEDGIMAGDIKPSLTSEVTDSGQYAFAFKVKNQTEQVQTLTLSGQEFDYILYKDGEKLEQYSDGRNFILILKEIQLKQGEEYEMKTVIKDLEKGNYKIEFWLADRNWPAARIIKDFSVK